MCNGENNNKLLYFYKMEISLRVVDLDLNPPRRGTDDFGHVHPLLVRVGYFHLQYWSAFSNRNGLTAAIVFRQCFCGTFYLVEVELAKL